MAQAPSRSGLIVTGRKSPSNPLTLFHGNSRTCRDTAHAGPHFPLRTIPDRAPVRRKESRETGVSGNGRGGTGSIRLPLLRYSSPAAANYKHHQRRKTPS